MLEDATYDQVDKVMAYFECMGYDASNANPKKKILVTVFFSGHGIVTKEGKTEMLLN